MMRTHFVGMLAVTVAMACTGTARAQEQSAVFTCGDLSRQTIKIQAIFRSNAGLNNSDFDCLAWQDFIYFMWPASPGPRGVPNTGARLGAAGPTVWETYRTVDTVFLPDGSNPGPWSDLRLMATLRPSLAQQVASGTVRHLTMTSKISRPVLANILRGGAAIPQAILNDISQAVGGTLYDLGGHPVYYEVAMDEAQYNYIVQTGLYDATRQFSFGQANVISLPVGADPTTNAVEMKAAWKVLSNAERQSGRFHTIQALLGGLQEPVTVGLVGFHVFVSRGDQGAWATFAQVDNAPVQQPATSGTFNFFNPQCTGCPINTANTDPGQVVQETPDDATADKLNAYAHDLLKQYDPKSPWQYYNLVNVQWPTLPTPLSKVTVPAAVPLPDGTPNTDTLVNAVVETFVQQPHVGCLSCHQYATTAASGSNATYASSYSFMFERARVPAK
jgi:hypothetical protein